MKPFRNIPIKRRLTLIAWAASGAALLLASIGLLLYEAHVARASLVEELLSTAKILGDNSSAALSFNDAQSAQQTLNSLRADTDVVGAVLYAADTRVFATYRNRASAAGRQYVPPAPAPDSYRFGDDSLELFHTIVLAGETTGTVYIRAELSEIRRRLWEYAAVLAALFVLASMLAMFLSTRLSAPITGSISHLSTAVARVAAEKDYSVRVANESEDELGLLSDGFNGMLQQIELREKALRDASDLLEQRVLERTSELRQENQVRIRTEEALHSSESNLTTALTMARAASWEYDVTQRRFVFNDLFYQVFRAEAAKVKGYRMSAVEFMRRFIHPEDKVVLMRELQDAIASKDPAFNREFELRIRHIDGKPGCASVRLFVGQDAGGATTRLYGIAQDVSERKKAERDLLRLNRALATLSAGNSAVVHAVSEASLLQNMCSAIVVTGHYALAWVGVAEHDAAKTVRPVAFAGTGGAYMSQVAVSWGEDERGQGAGGRCIRTGQLQVVQHIGDDPGMSPWHEAALQSGLQSNITLPLSDANGVFGMLAIYAAEAEAFDADEIKLLAEMAGDLSYGIAALRARLAHEASLQQVQRSMEGTVRSLASMVEVRDPYTAGHQRRVSEIAVAIGKVMGLAEDCLRGLGLGAEIHDIGKIKVPAEILAKPGKLSAAEFAVIKVHPAAGAEILEGVEFPWPIAEMIWQHHERLDGSGYPRRLKGEQILLEARIIAVADVVEAMASHRPYRPGKGLDAALAEIARGRGVSFDAEVVDACLKLFHELQYQLPE